jgi:hypothetical protein
VLHVREGLAQALLVIGTGKEHYRVGLRSSYLLGEQAEPADRFFDIRRRTFPLLIYFI